MNISLRNRQFILKNALYNANKVLSCVDLTTRREHKEQRCLGFVSLVCAGYPRPEVRWFESTLLLVPSTDIVLKVTGTIYPNHHWRGHILPTLFAMFNSHCLVWQGWLTDAPQLCKHALQMPRKLRCVYCHRVYVFCGHLWPTEGSGD